MIAVAWVRRAVAEAALQPVELLWDQKFNTSRSLHLSSLAIRVRVVVSPMLGLGHLAMLLVLLSSVASEHSTARFDRLSG